MDFPVEAPETQGRSVVVRVEGMLGDPQLLVDGAPLAPTEGRYLLPPKGDNGSGDPADKAEPVAIRLITPLLDRAPIVEIDGRRVLVAPPIGIATYAWCALPLVLLLIFGRGVLPALAGLALSYVSLYQLRAAPTERRYVASVAINVATLALSVGLMVMRRHGGSGSH